MKVRDLIKSTSWLPGHDYGGAAPAISVLLPTFRRGADGLFLKAARSVLDQTLREIELIIVDDASTDGTADQIDALMQKDGRVSCLRHAVNIGLPAVSEYEALLRARGRYLAFAFDDFIFEADAMARLLETSEHRRGGVVHGYVKFRFSDGRVDILGRDDIPYENLEYSNFIGNASFLVQREIVADVGFYDPHIGIARVCDWDLWRRIWRKYPIFRNDVLVGTEMGAALPDSLGRTYPSHLEAVQEYCNRPRNEALQVENYADFDVWDVPPDASAALAEQIVFVRRFFKTKEWAKAADLVTTVDTKTLISPHRHVIGVVSSFDASTWLYFDGMTDRLRQSLLFIPFNADAANLQSHLSRCDAVIVVRDLLTQRAGWIVKVCHLMKIPLYYLIDDNFIVLRDEVPELAAYTMDSVRAALAGFAAVICTSAALVEWFRRFHLHPTIMQFSASFDAQRFAKMQSVPRQRSDEIRVGFVGGLFRRRNLDEDVLPALASLHNDSPVAFFSHTPPEGPQPLSFATTVVARTGSYDAFLMRWRAAGLDLLVHPRGETKNAPYKTDSILLTALYLGAVPIVAAEGAFRDIGEEQGVLKVDGGRTEWERALRRAQDVSVRQRLMSRLDAFCRSHFTPERTAAVLENIFATWPPTDILTLHNRARDALSSANTAQVVELEDRLLAMRKSISWKITAPVREIQRFFRRLGVR